MIGVATGVDAEQAARETVKMTRMEVRKLIRGFMGFIGADYTNELTVKTFSYHKGHKGNEGNSKTFFLPYTSFRGCSSRSNDSDQQS